MNVKRKIFGIFISVLMLATIPLAAGMAVDSEPNDAETIGVEVTIIVPDVLGHNKQDGASSVKDVAL